MVQYQKLKKVPWYIITPTGYFSLIWDLFVNSIFIVSFFLIPLILSSNGDLLEDFWHVELIFDFIMLLDILTNFF